MSYINTAHLMKALFPHYYMWKCHKQNGCVALLNRIRNACWLGYRIYTPACVNVHCSRYYSGLYTYQKGWPLLLYGHVTLWILQSVLRQFCPLHFYSFHDDTTDNSFYHDISCENSSLCFKIFLQGCLKSTV